MENDGGAGCGCLMFFALGLAMGFVFYVIIKGLAGI